MTIPIPETMIVEALDKLTKVQQRELLSCWQDEARHAPYHVFRSTPSARKAWRDMLPMGMVTSEDEGFDLVIKRGRPLGLVVLTPLAIAVRSRLQESQLQ